MKMEQGDPKRRNINSRGRGITQKKAYNIQIKAKAWNQGFSLPSLVLGNIIQGRSEHVKILL